MFKFFSWQEMNCEGDFFLFCRKINFEKQIEIRKKKIKYNKLIKGVYGNM